MVLKPIRDFYEPAHVYLYTNNTPTKDVYADRALENNALYRIWESQTINKKNLIIIDINKVLIMFHFFHSSR